MWILQAREEHVSTGDRTHLYVIFPSLVDFEWIPFPSQNEFSEARRLIGTNIHFIRLSQLTKEEFWLRLLVEISLVDNVQPSPRQLSRENSFGIFLSNGPSRQNNTSKAHQWSFSSETKCTISPPRNCFSAYIILPFLIFFCSLKWDSAPRVFWQGNIWGWERKGGTGVFYEWDSVCPSTSGHLLMLYYEPSLVQQTPPSGWIRGFIIIILKEGLIVV